ncbi:hypothetical protein [Sphingomonas sp.]|uniref:hypothetical protein n=1 Tax=Sphingomonas sp. TaxID=28214 RepID=UPI0035C7AEF2
MRPLIALAPALLLAACGSAAKLAPAPGPPLPPAPAGAPVPPAAPARLPPPTQPRPRPVGEGRQNSEERRSDEFDLPPES